MESAEETFTIKRDSAFSSISAQSKQNSDIVRQNEQINFGAIHLTYDTFGRVVRIDYFDKRRANKHETRSDTRDTSTESINSKVETDFSSKKESDKEKIVETKQEIKADPVKYIITGIFFLILVFICVRKVFLFINRWNK